MVLCQHVLVYFREDTAAEILKRLARALAPGTVAIVSPVEAHLLGAALIEAARPRGGRAARSQPEPRPPRPAPASRKPARPAPPRRAPEGEAVAEVYVRSALEHASARRHDEALAAARAAWFAEPGTWWRACWWADSSCPGTRRREDGCSRSWLATSLSCPRARCSLHEAELSVRQLPRRCSCSWRERREGPAHRPGGARRRGGAGGPGPRPRHPEESGEQGTARALVACAGRRSVRGGAGAGGIG